MCIRSSRRRRLRLASGVVVSVVVTAGGFGVAAQPASAATSAAQVGRQPSSAGASSGTFVSAGPERVLDTRTALGGRRLAPGATLVLPVTGNGVVAPGAFAVAMNVTVTAPTAAGHLTVFENGTSRPGTSNLNFAKGQTVANLVVTTVSADGEVDFFNGSAGSTQLIADVTGYYVPDASAHSGDFVPVAPTRLLDTRSSTGGTAPGPRSDVTLQVAGSGPVPASGVSAVLLNVTVAAPTAAGFVTVYGTGQPRPPTSNLNFVAGRTVANLVLAAVGADGQVDLFNSAARTTQLVADVAGYFIAGQPSVDGGMNVVTPTRLLDTRTGLGGTPPSARAVLSVRVAGQGPIPNAGVLGVVLNVTVISPEAGGHISVYGDGSSTPTASNINFAAGQTVPNLVMVPVSASGRIDFYNSSSGPTDLVADVAGYYLSGPGKAWSWGSGLAGRLGDGAETDFDVATRVSAISNVTAVAGGFYDGYAVTSDGHVWAWGFNGAAELGNNSAYGLLSGSTVPVLVAGPTQAVAVAAGEDDGYALTADGHVWAWGANDKGQAGDGSDTVAALPVQVRNVSDVIAIAAGYSSAYALTADGHVWAWGLGARGALGNGSTANSNVPVEVSDLSGVVAIAGGYANGYALTADGHVWAWGDGDFGQLGNGSTSDSYVPVEVSGLAQVTAVSSSRSPSAFAVESDGSVWAWGSNAHGELGSGKMSFGSDVPVQVPGIDNIRAVSAGVVNGYALSTDGSVWAWGLGRDGSLGNGSITGVSGPVEVSDLSDVTTIAGGFAGAYVLGP